VAPRPIALVSTLDIDGNRNLAPLSFFNAFSANPPVVGFSASRRLRDSSVKDTYNNLLATKECVVQAVTFEMAHQVNLASGDFPPAVNEFEKSALTPVASEVVRPPRVEESPFQMECRLTQMVTLGEGGASGNLALCEVVRFHIGEDILEDGIVQPDRIELVARMGGEFYCRASGAAVFAIPRPPLKGPIGIDNLPDHIRNSKTLSAANLGRLGTSASIPTIQEARRYVEALAPARQAGEENLQQLLAESDYKRALAVARELERANHPGAREFYELCAKCALDKAGDSDAAWSALLYAQRDES
ncbi:MAG: flavin reductase family protein, partial [Candidatus Zixiibacteriota bacterium]